MNNIPCHVLKTKQCGKFKDNTTHTKMVDSSEIDTTLFTTDQSTTFSHTLDSSQSQATSRNLDVTRDDLERRQLSHTIQLLKLELSQKQLLLETVRSETGGQLEELREQLADAQHEKTLASLRLQSLTHAYEQEVKTLRERNIHLKTELEAQSPVIESLVDEGIVSDCLRVEVEQALSTPYLSEEEHRTLTSTTTLPVPDLVRLRVHELTETLKRKCGELGKQLADLGQEFQIQQRELQLSQQKEAEYREQTATLKDKLSGLKLELSEIKLQIQEGDYKIDNFDSIKRERDALRREVDGLKLKVQEIDTREGVTKEELSKLNTELTHSQQTESLQRQDKEYLGRQVSALTLRASEAEERAGSLSVELEQARRDRQSVYEQLMKSRDEQRLDYENRMQRELEALRARTALEINQMRTQTTEMMERDRRSLTEARDIALSERDTAQSRERDTSTKYQDLLKEHHGLQATSEGRASELQARLQVVQFERERVAMVTEDTTKQLSMVQLEREKLHKKVDLLSQELWRCQSEGETERSGLKTRVEEQRVRLEAYERVERDMDDLVMQAAQSESETDAERVLFSYGFGATLPTTSRRRLQQSVQLARRVLQLEKINVSLKIEQENKQEAFSKLQDKVKSVESLLEQSKQPYLYLIETIRDKDSQVNNLREELATTRRDVEGLRTERQRLVSVKNQMALDLEKLLSHNEELQKMKQLIYHNTRPIVQLATNDQHPDRTLYREDYPKPTLFTKPKKTRLKRNL